MKRIVFVVVYLVASLALFGLELNPKFDSDSVAGYQQKADAGDAEAAYLFSYALYVGIRHKKEDETDVMYRKMFMKYALQSADGGFGLAWQLVGEVYENGCGVETNVAKSAECFAKFVKYTRPQAENGDPWSQHGMGICYMYGKGVKKDITEAKKWIRKAAEQGHAISQHVLGLCYYKDRDSDEAKKWICKAAEQGYVLSQFHFGYLDLADQDERLMWIRRAADQGLGSALLYLGGLYEHGMERYCQKDTAEALEWYRKAAKRGIAAAKKKVELLANRAKSIEYNIEHNLELPETELKEVFDAVAYHETENEVRTQKYREHFLGKRIKVRATIKKVQARNGVVEVIVDIGDEKNIFARFDGMSEDEASNLNRGDRILFEGNIYDDPIPMTSRMIMDRCSMIRAAAGVQLWENGPFWAETNLGESEVQAHSEYGALYTFAKADSAVKSLLGPQWRVPSKDDFDKLVDESVCDRKWDRDRKGWIFTGKGAYSSKSIFFPVVGFDCGDGRESTGEYGGYWSSSKKDSTSALLLHFTALDVHVDSSDRVVGLSLRAVR